MAHSAANRTTSQWKSPGRGAPIFIEFRSFITDILHILVLAMVLVLLLPAYSSAHGFAGKRFFPTTFKVEDPFVSDELSLLFDHVKEPGDPPSRTTDVDLEYSKRITPQLGLSVGESYSNLDYAGDGTASGFGNLELGIKYQFLTSAEHETIISAGAGVEIGGTGASRVGAESFSVLSPAVFFGKGLGDLPQPLKFLRPFAVTGVVGVNFPGRSKNVTVNEDTGETEIERNPDTLTWSFTIQYSLIYLQSFVKDIGLGSPFKRMVVVVEFPMETCLDRGCKGQTLGTVNPGIVWTGKSFELGMAAQIPVNDRTGKNVGVLGLIHFFIDDLFPKSIGRPIFR